MNYHYPFLLRLCDIIFNPLVVIIELIINLNYKRLDSFMKLLLTYPSNYTSI